MGDKWNQRDVAGPLNSDSEGPLMLGADTGAAPGLDLRPVGHKPPDLVDILVVNQLDMFDAEGAYPAPGHETAPRPSSGSAARPRPSLWPAALGSWRSWGLRCFWRPAGGFSRHIVPVPSDIGSNDLRVPKLSLERQIVCFVVRGRSTVPRASASAEIVAVAVTAAASILIVPAAAEHLQFGEHYF